MPDQAALRAVLLDHYHRPRRRGKLPQADAVRRGRNPRCGDDIEVAVRFDGDRIADARFEGRGCSICLASASMLAEAATGCSRAQMLELIARVRACFEEGSEQSLPSPLDALCLVRVHPARHRCVLLSWQAMEEALAAPAA